MSNGLNVITGNRKKGGDMMQNHEVYSWYSNPWLTVLHTGLYSSKLSTYSLGKVSVTTKRWCPEEKE